MHSQRKLYLDATASRRAARAGFTLVELLLVLAILATLAAIVVPKFTGRREQADIQAAHTQISSFELALDTFEVDNGYYPKGSDGLEDLIVEPADARDWRGPYLKKAIPLDPWKEPYVYECPGKQNANGYDLMSKGPDKQAGSADDITNW
ncbi:MAG TPA: type II secretion system major pseudopilin GspG [Sumerlaeia bacterium]|nr:type II secretion system major pseudopilin GspG [Sumerlaeia bacterium]